MSLHYRAMPSSASRVLYHRGIHRAQMFSQPPAQHIRLASDRIGHIRNAKPPAPSTQCEASVQSSLKDAILPSAKSYHHRPTIRIDLHYRSMLSLTQKNAATKAPPVTNPSANHSPLAHDPKSRIHNLRGHHRLPCHPPSLLVTCPRIPPRHQRLVHTSPVAIPQDILALQPLLIPDAEPDLWEISKRVDFSRVGGAEETPSGICIAGAVIFGR